jgi:ribosome-binding factor A
MSRHRRPQGFDRTDRIADQIHRDLSELVQFSMKDPRLGMVTIQHVKVSRDLSWADVYFTVLGETGDAAREAEKVLQHAAGFLRSQLAAGLNIRQTPKLRFHYDEIPEQASHLDSLIKQARDADREIMGDDDEHNEE